MASSYRFSFYFGDNSVVIPPAKVNEVLIKSSELLQMLHRNHAEESSTISVRMFSHETFICNLEAFNHFLKCIECEERCSLVYFYEIVNIICYLLLDKGIVDIICPYVPVGEMKPFLKAVHQLLCHGYINVVEKRFTECRLPLFLLTNFNSSFHKFKKKYISAARYQEWYQTKCQVNCRCDKCTMFRSERFLQLFDGGGYSTPYFGTYTKTPLGPRH